MSGALNRKQFPVSKIEGLYHGTTEDAANSIVEHGFRDRPDADYKGLVFSTKDPDTAQIYADGRAKHSGGKPAVLAFDVEGVSAEHTGYSHWLRNQEAGADYQDEGPRQTVVLNHKAISNLRRHS